jgi:hypothetical protein
VAGRGVRLADSVENRSSVLSLRAFALRTFPGHFSLPQKLCNLLYRTSEMLAPSTSECQRGIDGHAIGTSELERYAGFGVDLAAALATSYASLLRGVSPSNRRALVVSVRRFC